jgi:hypothetical protein
MVMRGVDSFHLWSLLRACGRRNKLVRTSDRIELLIIALGVLIALAATAFAGALGTAVHDARSQAYVAEAQTRHTVIATAIADSTTALGVRDNAVTRVHARWQVDGAKHTDSFTIDGYVKTGDPLTIWVDRDGNRVDAPTRTSQAGVDAVAAAYAAWLTVVLTVTGLVWWARSGLDRRRMSGWERDLRSLVYGGGSGNRKV